MSSPPGPDTPLAGSASGMASGAADAAGGSNPQTTPPDASGTSPATPDPGTGRDEPGSATQDSGAGTPGSATASAYVDWADMTFEDSPSPPAGTPAADENAIPDAPASSPAGGSPPPEGPPPAAASPPAEGAPSAAPATGTSSPPAASDDAKGNMPLMGHLNELRFRLVRCLIAAGAGFLICWGFVDPIFDALVAPLLQVLPENSTAIYTTLPEGFFIRMFVAFVAGLFLASPVVFFQLWSFIAPGLYEEEKRLLLPIAAVSAVFFVAGGSFCYLIVFPYAFAFFVSYSTEAIVVMPKVSDYLDFALKLLLAFGLIFEMPLFAFFLSRMGIVTAAMMRRARRYAVVVIFIVAAVLTPPDVVSQLLMAAPMLLLYEGSILVAAAFGRRKPAETPNDEEENRG